MKSNTQPTLHLRQLTESATGSAQGTLDPRKLGLVEESRPQHRCRAVTRAAPAWIGWTPQHGPAPILVVNSRRAGRGARLGLWRAPRSGLRPYPPLVPA